MSAPNRNRLTSGGLIDRAKPLGFSFDGTAYRGYEGDTLASALLANGVRLVGRSFKYHRPRGIVAAGAEEPNALVELRSGARREPNTRATVTELYDGLEAASQNRWPSLAVDALSLNRFLSPFLGAGFYYKTFMWPAALWEKLYEPVIRRAAGLGRAAAEADPDHYEKVTAFCDLLVIGAGPAGLMAARAAARSGARVILADEDFLPGGALNAEAGDVGRRPAPAFAAHVVAELMSLPNVRVMRRTTVFGVYDSGTYGALERVSDHRPEPLPFQPRQRLWRLVARRAVLAAGATERPIVFGGNDRPGVMLAGAVGTYVQRHAALPGQKIALFANNDGAWRQMLAAHAAGAPVETILDVRAEVAPALVAAARAEGIRVLTGAQVIATAGKTLTGLTVATASGTERIAADTLAVSGGWSPAVHLTCHHGGKPVWDDAIAAFVPGTCPPGLAVAGAARGVFGLGACLTDGAAKGAEAAQALGFTVPALDVPEVADAPFALAPFWHVEGSQGAAFVDLQNDVTAKDVGIAHREGFRSVELLKRYTTLGMATDQGRTSNVTGLAIMARLTGASIPETGTTIFRPPYTPVSLGALAGHHRGKDFRPVRLTPTHEWAREQGAVFIETGAWLRAQYFPRKGEKDWLETVSREVKAVRAGVGMIDVSTFGKIDLQGADVGAFLDRVYINGFAALAVGKARYGVMLREDGMVMDDGTTARLSPERYVMTTTTANAAKVFQHLEFCLQVLWPELDVALASVSEQWAQIALAGPRARDVLARVADGDVSNAALPFMGAIEGTVMGGVKARLFRLSFSGELGYEIAVPARHGAALAKALMAAGEEFGITPYGIEALGVMRIEKGHVSGNELSGQTTAGDLGFGRMASTKKDYIGRVMAARPGLTDPERPCFVGFKPVDRARRLRAGAHFLPLGAAPTMANDQGYMTSVAYSPHLGHWIGLGLIRRGPERLGERVRAYDPVRGEEIEVEICAPGFIDPEGVRLRG
ncbi:sarcosine oxidase subunit alpha family protein [Ancylobacter polymorphus]|uniref:Sarcosine oxidase subunit alpha family protein n=1 Tax=Ancylobacter polymorphus TaxID=223390 RepID=A0A9E7A5S0_9HYPH|nr:sarcosine oxidase subunit alpha family protein [Ancylobacter polymorphus]UOK71239.1 sarcosine oxidase subunit alpha family protein [Ancylobacter polymorphus]